MAFARRTLMAQGVPAHAWAGIVLIGDAELRLEAPPSWPPSFRHLAALGVFVFALLAFGRLAFLRWFTSPRLRIGAVDRRL